MFSYIKKNETKQKTEQNKKNIYIKNHLGVPPTVYRYVCLERIFPVWKGYKGILCKRWQHYNFPPLLFEMEASNNEIESTSES